ncbi:MAG: EcsC family protein [Myxococcaceae bacterium]|nr:EcsC family protein [Myxococcaceae bacterium]
MAWHSPLTSRLTFLRVLTPKGLKALGDARLTEVVAQEAVRARKRLDELHKRYPTAGPREVAQRLIDSKKSFASMVGGVSGVFGVVTVPADLLVMVYLQLSLLVEIATLYKVNLKSDRSRSELLELFGYANGVGPVQRASPKVLGKLASVVLQRGGLHTLGRAMPLVAAPVSAYLNNQHIQRVGEEAVRHYDGFGKAHEKSAHASGG